MKKVVNKYPEVIEIKNKLKNILWIILELFTDQLIWNC